MHLKWNSTLLPLVFVFFTAAGCGSGVCAPSEICQASVTVCPPCEAVKKFSSLLASLMHRSKTATQKTLEEELAIGTGALPTGYRQVTRIASDDDSFAGGSSTAASRPSTTCGTTQSTIEDRVTDCATKNPTTATWDGATNGNAGQGKWSLVTFDGTNEVWRDERTQLVWSDRLGIDIWCYASGSSGGGPFGEVDPFNYCDNAANQSQVTPISWCTEDSGLNTPAGGNSAKGGMRFTATVTSPSVRWRLPTVYDYQMANINGIRMVLPHWTEAAWTATVVSHSRDMAWYFDATLGGVVGWSARLDPALQIRCVGR